MVIIEYSKYINVDDFSGKIFTPSSSVWFLQNIKRHRLFGPTCIPNIHNITYKIWYFNDKEYGKFYSPNKLHRYSQSQFLKDLNKLWL